MKLTQQTRPSGLLAPSGEPCKKGIHMGRDLCKLTGERGKFVKSHLIPEALTRPVERSSPLVQIDHEKYPVRRWSSWYDTKLVTQAGENILSFLDNWAVATLRKHRLVWSGWGPVQVPPGVNNLAGIYPMTPPNSGWGYRLIKGIDPGRLRLFFLSLLWRAAATDREEFSQVVMPPGDLEKLRLMLINENPDPISFYPTELGQFSTAGVFHNRVPIPMTKSVERQGEKIQIPFFRFYFDGLTAHVHRRASDDGLTWWFGSSIVGMGDNLAVATVLFDTSFQHEGLKRVLTGSLPMRRSVRRTPS